MNYNWQHKEWLNFSYTLWEAEDGLFLFAEKTGHITGLLKAPAQGPKNEAIIGLRL